MFVSNTFGKTDYFVLIDSGLQKLQYNLKELRHEIKVSELTRLCQIKLNSEVFKVNSCNEDTNDDECQNMCELLSKLYGS